MFRPVRKKKNEISAEAAKTLLCHARRGVLAVQGDDGYPYAIPVNYLYDESARKIYFHGARAGHKVDALRACDKVCFTVLSDEIIRDEPWAPYMQSAVVFGRCRLLESRPEALALIKRLAMKYYPDERLAEEEIAASGKKIPGLSTGLVDLDRTILGLNKSELILVAARPGMGKTSIALDMALYAAMSQRKTVAMFSLEMSREQLVSRLLSRAARVPGQGLMTGQLTEQQWRDIADAAQALSATDIRIDDNPTLTVSDMNAQCRRVEGLDLVVIDYLQLMQSAGSGHTWSNESRTQAVSDISRMMKIMAKELNVPVVCLSQLSRANESRQDKRPMLSDLRESGAIEQDADVVIGLYREGYYNKECAEPDIAEAIVLKNRKGETGTVRLRWMPEYTSFGSVSDLDG